ncbi:hypothetical protein N9089_04330 [Crocinitomicaceae bacterium]|nr:hypothetical protein [Crocinitomicaceae bacterium]
MNPECANYLGINARVVQPLGESRPKRMKSFFPGFREDSAPEAIEPLGWRIRQIAL